MASREELGICCPGVVLALSFAEHLEAKGDVLGLLFGAVTRSSHSAVSDIGTTRVQRTAIDVQVMVPHVFTDPKGTVDTPAVEAAIKAHPEHQFLGWFAFRANSPLRPSLRELHIHEQMETLPAIQETFQGLRPTLALMTTSASQKASTHSFDYLLLSRPSPASEMETLPLSITNLKHDSQAEYGSFAAATQPSRTHASLAPLLQVPPPAVVSLETFASETQGQLDALVAEVEAQRREEAQLLAEIKPLRERLSGVLAPDRAA